MKSSAQKISSQILPEVWLTRLENMTTKSDLLAQNPEQKMKVSMVHEHGFRLLLSKPCAAGHFVMIDFLIVTPSFQNEMGATGKVLSQSKVDTQYLVDVEFKKYDKKVWEDLLKKLEKRQDRVNELFALIKGE